MKTIGHSTGAAPQPEGPYSMAASRGNLLALSGQVGINNTTGHTAEGLTAQAEQAFNNLGAVLAAAGTSWAGVIMLRVYLTDTAHFEDMNDVAAKYMPIPEPARTTVYVTLPGEFLIEIDALAVLASHQISPRAFE